MDQIYLKGQVLLIIDMQKGLLQKDVFNKEALINNVNSLIKYFHDNNKQVFFIRHTNSSFSKLNSDEWQISNKLNISSTDIFINKKHSSVFKEKGFTALLRDKNTKGVVIAGLVSNGCVQAACLDAKSEGFSVTLIRDGHSTFNKDAENIILDWNMRLMNKGIQLIHTEEFILSK